ncbi:MAG: hypothetical protein M0Z41_14260 [Peptococcaceae bacterium]|nr:hypothetical protein [Peptococcaceae bacterium]
MATYRTLIASGDPWTARAVAGDPVREGYGMAMARSVGEAARLKRCFHPDLVIVDYQFLNTAVRPAGPDVPLLVPTSGVRPLAG